MRTEALAMNLCKHLPALALLVATTPAFAHDLVPAAPQSQPIVIDGATIHPVSRGPIVAGRARFEGGKLVAVGGREVSTDGAEIVDARGKHLYPGLIAAHSVLGLVEIGAVRATVDIAEVGGANAANVRAEVAVNPDSDVIPVTRSNGVLLALSAPQASATSVITGTSALLQLDGWSWEDMTVKAPVALHVVWPSRFMPAGFPSDMVDAARKAATDKRDALKRAFDDARAYAVKDHDGAPDLRLAAMQSFLDRKGKVFLHAEDAQSIDDALEFATQQKLSAVIVGGAEAWRVVDRLRAQDVPVIIGGTHVLPLRRADPTDAMYANASKLAAAGVRYAIATPGDGFDTSNLRNLPYQAASAVAYGLPKDEALKAITLYPAQILGVADRFGSIEVGKDATLFLTDGDPLDARTTVEQAWIAGRQIDLSNRQTKLYDKYRQKYPQTRDAK
jgi:imidazolonepropionase-like amidohydrolase